MRGLGLRAQETLIQNKQFRFDLRFKIYGLGIRRYGFWILGLRVQR
jgi:hypothetical protein